jgi:uncharacterized Fe-S cluster protein YjdI
MDILDVMGEDAGGADRERIKEYPGLGIVVTWQAGRCQHATECVRGLPQVFDSQVRPWIDPSRATADEIVEVIDRCPSFALGYRTEDGRARVAPLG